MTREHLSLVAERQAWQQERANLLLKQMEERQAHAALVEGLRELVGQVLQARDGFGIWPYEGSDSMAQAIDEAQALLAAAHTTTTTPPYRVACNRCGAESHWQMEGAECAKGDGGTLVRKEPDK